jgi:hypothetical protein
MSVHTLFLRGITMGGSGKSVDMVAEIVNEVGA